jgi:sec-independent protein translocase protein TatA
MSVGFTEILLIALFILLVFGAQRIPELARALGRASYEFQKAKSSFAREGEELLNSSGKASVNGDKRNI